MDVHQAARSLKENPSLCNLYAMIQSHKENIATEYLSSWQLHTCTYGEQDQQIRIMSYQIKQALRDKKDGMVALQLDNSPLWSIFFWGILMAGYKPLLLDFRYDRALTCHLLTQAGAIAIIHQGDSLKTDIVELHPTSLKEKKEVPPLDWKVSFGEELALCTSGSTETARVFVFNGPSIVHSILNLYEGYRINSTLLPEGEAKILAFVPFSHVYGLIVTYFSSSLLGKTLVYLKNRAPSTLLLACHVHKVTHIYGIPLLWNHLASAVEKKLNESSPLKRLLFHGMCGIRHRVQERFPKLAKRLTSFLFAPLHKRLLGSHIVLLTSGGGPILPQTLRLINALGYVLVCGYGMTEIGITSIEGREDLKKRLSASLGQPLGDCAYKVLPLPGIQENHTGELYVKTSSLYTAQVIKGVYHPPVTEEGWFATGDIATYYENTLWIKGRKKEVMINESGENVYPDELESLFCGISGIKQLCVLGLPKDEVYEDITLVFHSTKEEDPFLLLEGIHQKNNELPLFKRVQRVFFSFEPLPMTNTMKVQRQIIKEQLLQKSETFLALDLDQKMEGLKEVFQDRGSSSEDLQGIKGLIRSALSTILGISPTVIGDDTHIIHTLGADSLSSVELLVELEEHFQMQVPEERYYLCTTVEELGELVHSLLEEGVDGKGTGGRF